MPATAFLVAFTISDSKLHDSVAFLFFTLSIDYLIISLSIIKGGRPLTVSAWDKLFPSYPKFVFNSFLK